MNVRKIPRTIFACLAIAAAALICVGAYAGYRAHRNAEFIASIAPKVQYISLRVDQASAFVRGGGIPKTEAEEKIARVINDIDAKIIEIKSIPTASEDQNAKISAAVTYAVSGQRLLREINDLSEKMFAFFYVKNAIKRMDASASNQAVEEIEKAGNSAIEQTKKVKETVARMRESATEIEKFLPREVVIDPATLEVIEKKM